MADWQTAVINEDGERLAVFSDPHAAYQWAVGHGFDELFADQALKGRIPNPTGFFSRHRSNPAEEGGPLDAWKARGFLRVDWAEVEKLTVDDAYKRIMQLRMPRLTREGISTQQERLWPLTKVQQQGTVPVKRWRSPGEFVRNILQTNAKLSRPHPSHRAKVTALSMLPAFGAKESLYGRVSGITEGTNLCVGSNTECRDSCLVFNANNARDPHNTRIKMAKTGALFADPVAFARLLYENCRIWAGAWGASQARIDRPKGKHGRQPLVRLNVYSDVPWELVFPELFTRLPNLMYYDYTKIPARPELAAQVQSDEGFRVHPFPDNYHLTFSASGTNEQDAHDEWRRGRGVAVVFANEKGKLPQWYDAPFLPGPLPVADGVEYDARPFDPSAAALSQAQKKLGPWTLDMTDKQRRARQLQTMKLAYRLTFGSKGAPVHYRDYPKADPTIIGLMYKAPLKAEQREKAAVSQAKGAARAKRSETKRAFLVSVVPEGQMIMAPGCKKTVSFTTPVIPAATTGVLELDSDEEEILRPAAKRRSPRLRQVPDE